ncbi:carbohydrate sulfotransferase 11-like isoform X1 [Oculina patagonica]
MSNIKTQILFFLLLLPTLILVLYWSSEMTSHHNVGQLANILRTLSIQAREPEEKSSPNPFEQTQMARQRHLKDYCLEHKFNERPMTERLHFIVVDDEHEIMFCTIPKVASTTWKRVLADLRGLRQGISVHRPKLWRHLEEYRSEEKSFRLKTYFKFIFVREPLHRLLSAFKDTFIGKNRNFSKKIRQGIVKALRAQDFDPNGESNLTFSEFVQFYSRDVKELNPHWRQYEDLCYPCFINYDFIGHLETLKEDASLLLKMAGIEDLVTFPPIHNSTGSSDMIDFYSTVRPEYITRLADKYRNSFELFGYEFLGPVKQLLNQSSVDSD